MQTNVLAEWLSRTGDVHATRKLALRVVCRWQTIHDIARGKSVPRADMAKRIEAATGGEVRAAVLIGLEAPPPRKRGRKPAAVAQ